MTCIVGVQHDGRVYIGGDSAGIAGYDISVRSDVKVFKNGPYVMGFAGSFRMGQLLHHAFAPPKPAVRLDRFMVTTFIDAVRECLDKGGWLTTKNGLIEGGTFFVGIAGRLFLVESDFQVGTYSDGYAAIGCGSDLALGSLHTTIGLEPRLRIKAALGAAAHHSAGVCGPFTVKVTPAAVAA